MKQLNLKLGELDKRLNKVTKEVKQTQGEQATSISDIQGNVKVLTNTLDNNTNNVKTFVLAEMKNRDSKKNNVIILGLKEPDNNDAESKEVLFAEEDETLETLFNDMSLGSEVNKSVVFRKRLGKREGDKPMPLMLCLKEPVTKTLVMNNACKLKLRRPNISIRPDLTQTQRQEEQDFIKEVRAANEESPKDELWGLPMKDCRPGRIA